MEIRCFAPLELKKNGDGEKSWIIETLEWSEASKQENDMVFYADFLLL